MRVVGGREGGVRVQHVRVRSDLLADAAPRTLAALREAAERGGVRQLSVAENREGGTDPEGVAPIYGRGRMHALST